VVGAVAELASQDDRRGGRLALAAAKARGSQAGRVQGQGRLPDMRERWAEAVRKRVQERAADCCPAIEHARAASCASLRPIATELNARKILTPPDAVAGANGLSRGPKPFRLWMDEARSQAREHCDRRRVAPAQSSKSLKLRFHLSIMHDRRRKTYGSLRIKGERCCSLATRLKRRRRSRFL